MEKFDRDIGCSGIAKDSRQSTKMKCNRKRGHRGPCMLHPVKIKWDANGRPWYIRNGLLVDEETLSWLATLGES